MSPVMASVLTQVSFSTIFSLLMTKLQVPISPVWGLEVPHAALYKMPLASTHVMFPRTFSKASH
jgi:hypothetical protein